MSKYCELITYHDTKLAADLSTGDVAHITDAVPSSEFVTLIGFFPENEKNICFLIPRSITSVALNMPGTDLEGQIIPLRSTPPNANGSLSFYNPGSGHYLVAGPPDEETGVGPVAMDRVEIDDFERFTIQQLSPLYVPQSAASVGNRFEKVMQAGLQPQSLMRFLQEQGAGADWVPIIEAVARLMPQEQIEYFVHWLKAAPRALQRLGEIYQEDIDATVALPRLFEWLASRSAVDRPPERDHEIRRTGLSAKLFGIPGVEKRAAARRDGAVKLPEQAASPSPERLGPNLDFIGSRGFSGSHVSFPHSCNVLMRQSVSPRRTVCAIATARNEGLCLLEWIAYHRSIGIESFFLYSNDNSDGSDELLAALAKAGQIVWFPSDIRGGTSPQDKAYGHALGVLPDILDYRWSLIIDLDEFFVFNPDMFSSIADYIAWQETQPVDAIALSWVIIYSGGQVRWRDEPLVRRFRNQFANPAPLIKTLFRPRKFIHATPHHPTAYGGTHCVFRNSDRSFRPHDELENPSTSEDPVAYHAWINHYFFKSAEEFLWKWARGRPGEMDVVREPTTRGLTKDFVQSFMNQYLAADNIVSHDTIERCAPDLDAQIRYLKSFPGVTQASELIKEMYRSRIGDVVTLFESAPGIVEAGEMGAKFLALLKSQTAGSTSEAEI